MKREEIIASWDGMTPRDRDAWVEEVVLRTTVYRDIMGDVYDNCTGLPLPKYTTEISAAWSVLSAIPGEFYFYRESADKYVASFGYVSEEQCFDCGEEPFEITAQAIAPTAPEAICLAAIIAKLTEAT